MTAPAGPEIEVRCPPGWRLADVAARRLVTTLRAAPPEVDAVVSCRDEPVAGASYVTMAERRLVERGREPPTVGEGDRPDRPTAERIDRGRGADEIAVWWYDPAVAALREGDGPDQPQSARPEGRSPFRSRPVAAFVGTVDGPALRWASGLVDQLVDAEVEARLLSPRPDPTVRLAPVCTPSPASLEALAPEVVIALDDEALALLAADDAPERTPVVVTVDPSATAGAVRMQDTPDGGELAGRRRATVDLATSSAALIDLIHRLAAGPRPGRPT